jgi:hypothetical protein
MIHLESRRRLVAPEKEGTQVQLRKLVAVRTLVPALVALALTAPVVASASTPSFPVGSRPVFTASTKAAAAKRFGMYITIANARKLDRNGQLKQSSIGTFARMHNAGHGKYTYKPPAYTFPSWFMQTPGKYWWQTYYIDCHFKGCHRLSGIHSFAVVALPPGE